jgi:hypothetical protein
MTKSALRLFGAALICAGALVTMLGVVPSLNSLGAASNRLEVVGEPEALCSPGETLETNTGRSSYTPGQGYAASVQYFCVTAAGDRREVTGAFAQTALSGISALLAGTGAIMIGIMGGGCVGTVGLVLLVGSFFVRGRRSREKPDDPWDAG